MATNYVNLSENTAFTNAKRGVIVVRNAYSLPGGRTLDTTGFAPTVIPEGHVIIRENATGTYKPMPVNAGGTAYEALPASHSYAGFNVADVPTSKPFAGVCVHGMINDKASVFPMTTILAAVKTALPHILFVSDNQ